MPELGINSNNALYTNSQILNTSFSKTTSKAKSAVYAEKGEPTYQKDMDKDNDGIITLEEFKDYCDENNISVSQRKQMLKNRLNYQLQKERNASSQEIREIKTEPEKIYAKSDDKSYDEAMDADKDGKVTYEEYVNYCKENAKEAKNTGKAEASIEQDEASDNEKVVVKDYGKAIKNYSSSAKQPEGKVKEEA